MRKNCQCYTNVNDWNAFECLPQQLDLKNLQINEQRRKAHRLEVRQVEQYWETRIELVFALSNGCSCG